MTKLSNECTGVKSLPELFHHHRKSYRLLARLFDQGNAMTTREIRNNISMSEATVFECLRHFKEARLVYVCHWKQSPDSSLIWFPVYQAGNKTDVKKPAPKNPKAKENSKRFRDRQKDDPPPDLTQHWQELSAALVPRRTDLAAIHSINRQYLNWISGGAYG